MGSDSRSDISGVMCALATGCGTWAIAGDEVKRSSTLCEDMVWRVSGYETAPAANGCLLTRCHPCTIPSSSSVYCCYVGSVTLVLPSPSSRSGSRLDGWLNKWRAVRCV